MDDSELYEQLRLNVRSGRHRKFMKKTIEKIAEGEPIPQAMQEAVQETYRVKRYREGPHANISAYRKAAKLIQRPDLQRGFALMFEAEGFDERDAIKRHIEHIKTPVPGSPLGNYQALRDYWLFTTPKPTLKVNVHSENVHAVVVRRDPNQAPAIRARILPKADDIPG